ncbi:MAG: hypothetical protein GF334_04425 [Candidatus Altiarchaeales archaeon]|nr:hypothetical protein [Candidatus Altiarchaeales archaeon]
MSQPKKWNLKIKKNRPSSVRAGGIATIATYTLDRDYVHTYDVNHGYYTTRKVQPLGSVVAMDPITNKVVPNFTSYGFGEIGVTLKDADVTDVDQEIGVLIRGFVREEHCWDDGDYGSVIAATKTALAGRVEFVKISNRGLKTIHGK